MSKNRFLTTKGSVSASAPARTGRQGKQAEQPGQTEGKSVSRFTSYKQFIKAMNAPAAKDVVLRDAAAKEIKAYRSSWKAIKGIREIQQIHEAHEVHEHQKVKGGLTS